MSRATALAPHGSAVPGRPEPGDLAALVDARLRELIDERRDSSRSLPQPFAQLWECLAHLVSGGKKIRPRLLLEAYAALGGTDARAAVDAACATELLHVALILHDDVIDKDLVRRGEMNISGHFASQAMLRGADITRARGWGETSSLLAGDLMLTLAQSLLARLPVAAEKRLGALDAFDRAVFASAAGEHADVWLSLNLEQASAYDVLSMIENKTAAYSFEAPLTLAGILAGAEDALLAELAAIAKHLGVIYQLRDDVLGVFGDEHETGKSTLSDLREGKETLLVTFARADRSWPEVQHLFGDPELTPDGGRRLRAAIEASGARDLVESLITDRCEHVNALVSSPSIPTALADRLSALAETCAARTA
ncbi:geranylgeranyl diphosphate synthase, type II [Paramicrobacterium humi]|uniref:Geranylgeranyl diphosphate synthase, type II n=1 Tax=Paramicrobacterium humi TaxID=640635 RepID=A0A1H4N7Q0_9MICO|nr:polyprenyl synthetase family protein [Microbacterium humi]SEB91490.1 geranylgeranyl diphosphate synthase, type II [Microbacterium humi]